MARPLITAADCKELPIPQGLVAWWAGTYTSIPTGWEIADGTVSANDPTYTKPSLCNGRFPKACTTVGEIPGTTGGAATHSHTVPSHSGHAQGASSGATYSDTRVDNGGGDKVSTHTHTSQTATADSLNAADHTPPYAEAIPIVYTRGSTTRGLLTNRDFTAAAVPDHKLIFGWHSAAAAPSGWAKCDGSTVNGVTTPNLLGKYLKGIPNTLTEPGNTGGTNTHSHDVSHSHVSGTDSPFTANAPEGAFRLDAHTHTLGTQSLTTDAPNSEPPNVTTHFVCFVGYGAGGASASSGIVTDADVEPSMLVPRGVVAIWSFSLATKPTKWQHCDGGTWANSAPSGYGANRPNLLGRYVKHVPNSTTNGGTVGGNATHTHTAAGHSHTISSGESSIGSSCGLAGGALHVSIVGHSHTVASTTWTASPWTTANDPAYQTVAFIVRD